MQPTDVWDLPTRLFHWALAAFVFLALATGEDEGIVFYIHAAAGHGVLALLAFRLVWGANGSPRSRFADFIRPASVVRAYLGDLVRLRPPSHVGHNPLGGWMIVLLLAASGAAAGTGILVLDYAFLEGLHEGLANFLIFLIAIHVGGVLVDGLLTGDNLIRAMFTGRKNLAPDRAAAEKPLAPRWLGIALLIGAAVLWIWLVGTTRAPA